MLTPKNIKKGVMVVAGTSDHFWRTKCQVFDENNL